MGLYAKCPRSYRLKVENPPIELDKPAIHIGSLFHDAMEFTLKAEGYNKEEIALRFVDDSDQSKKIKSTVTRMIRDHFPRLGIGTSLKPLDPEFIELKFNHEIIPGVVVTGLIDAVLINEAGEVILVDWKCRGTLYEDEDVFHDTQLHLYSYILSLYGVNVDKAYQVQLSTKGRNIHLSQIDLNLTDFIMKNFIENCKRLADDEEYPGIFRSWDCKFCDFKNHCFNELLENH